MVAAVLNELKWMRPTLYMIQERTAMLLFLYQ